MHLQRKSTNKIRNTVKIGAFSPIVSIANPMANAKEIVGVIEDTAYPICQCDIIATPELSITGYSCQDMFFNKKLLDETIDAIKYIANNVSVNKTVIVGAPIVCKGALYNCAVMIKNHKITGVIPKTHIANYGEFYEARWFKSYNGERDLQCKELNMHVKPIIASYNNGVSLSCEICEDLWAPNPPSTELALSGANIIVNCSASNEIVSKSEFRRNLVKMQSAKTLSAYIYCSSGISESTSDVIYSGHNMIVENGKVLAESELFDIGGMGIVVADIDLDILTHERIHNKTFSSFSKRQNIENVHIKDITTSYDVDLVEKETHRTVSILPFVPSDKQDIKNRCVEIFKIQSYALASRWINTGSKHVVIGVSGGLDSTLALLVACKAADIAHKSRKNVVGITMPCFGTTNRTKNNAIELMQELGCELKEINISKAVKQHLDDLGISEDDRSIAFENAQARERTQVLMDYANMIGGFVIGTGDLSELALGWCTYNGDHMSMYSVNGSIPKTLVKSLIENIGEQVEKSKRFEKVLKDILNTPVSPELLPPNKDGSIQQLTEESVGPYVLNDFFIYYHVRYGMSPEKIMDLAKVACEQSNEYKYSDEEILRWLNKFYIRFERAQFKRNCCPDGVKVGSVSLNPRGDWRCPSELNFSKICF